MQYMQTIKNVQSQWNPRKLKIHWLSEWIAPNWTVMSIKNVIQRVFKILTKSWVEIWGLRPPHVLFVK